jgi:peptidyl-prolyl cis-trans isomerase SurA
VQETIRAAAARVGQPEYLLSEIFIPLDDPRNEAEVNRFTDEVIRQLRAGIPFPVAATQFSQAQTALQGGDLGWTRKEELDPAVAAVAERMPPGAVSNAIKVPGGYQIVTLRQKRESGRDLATMISVRQAYFPFAGTLDPNNPTQQQRDQVDKAQRLATSARSCDASRPRPGAPAGPTARPTPARSASRR